MVASHGKCTGKLQLKMEENVYPQKCVLVLSARPLQGIQPCTQACHSVGKYFTTFLSKALNINIIVF